MKKQTTALLLFLLLIMQNTASAHKEPVPRMYMFGLAASFTDTIVHFTPIQALDSVWVDTKYDFLQERDAYSYQLRDYLDQKQQMPHRTCVVFYSKSREKIEKKYQKMKRLYTHFKDGRQHFDVRYLDDSQFHFTTINMAEYMTEAENEEAGDAPTKEKGKLKEKKDMPKKGKKNKSRKEKESE